MKVKDIGEFGLIERIAEIVEHADERVVVTIGDDTAVVRQTSLALTLLTTDLLVEDIHFKLSSITPWQLGYKSMAVNISDIAAMGGLPNYAVVSLAINPETELSFVEDLYYGMDEISRKYNLKIVGGDITKSEKLIINIALIGEVEEENLCRRSDAKVGDLILVTGELGASAAGLRLILNPSLEKKLKDQPGLATKLKNAHFLPEPRVKEGRILASIGINAMEDISDGLASEINHICEASDVGARIFQNKVPIAKGVETVASLTSENPIDLALCGGEDYELIFTAAPNLLKEIEIEFKTLNRNVYAIGEIVDANNGITITDWSGKERPLLSCGFAHF